MEKQLLEVEEAQWGNLDEGRLEVMDEQPGISH